MREGYVRNVGATGVNLVARSYVADFSEQWFNPEFWAERAVPVTKGGRGSAWFVHSPVGDLVLRQFSRGGLPGRFIRSEYVYTGEDRVRSFAEFRLLDQLYRQGFPVPEPVAAGYQRQASLFYRASIIIRRIPGAAPLTDYSGADCLRVWKAAGGCVRRFHDARVYHADLNCMNILVAGRAVYLIDFDRGKIVPLMQGDRWKAENIGRLQRSVTKCLGDVDDSLRLRLWQAFMAGYEGGGQ